LSTGIDVGQDFAILRFSFDLAVRFRADQVIYRQKIRDVLCILAITSMQRAYGIYLEILSLVFI